MWMRWMWSPEAEPLGRVEPCCWTQSPRPSAPLLPCDWTRAGRRRRAWGCTEPSYGLMRTPGLPGTGSGAQDRTQNPGPSGRSTEDPVYRRPGPQRPRSTTDPVYRGPGLPTTRSTELFLKPAVFLSCPKRQKQFVFLVDSSVFNFFFLNTITCIFNFLFLFVLLSLEWRM